MSDRTPADLFAILDALGAAGVELVVVGGVAAILHGAELTTRDVDIVPERSPANLARLRTALEALQARVRDPAGRDLEPVWSAMSGPGHHLLTTSLGPLDVLGELAGGLGYDELRARSELLSDDRLRVRVIDLPTLIEVKTRLGRPRDRVALPVLIALLEERRRG